MCYAANAAPNKETYKLPIRGFREVPNPACQRVVGDRVARV